MSDNNPRNSSVIQIMLDTAAVADPAIAQLATQMIEALNNHPSDIAKIDHRYNLHRYPSNAVRFVQVPTVNDLSARYYDLSATARDLLNLLIRACQRGRLVQVKNDVLATALTVSKSTIIRAKNELTTAGYISITQPAHAQTPDTIHVSPLCVASGRDNLTRDNDPPYLSVRITHVANEPWINVLEEAQQDAKTGAD